jgi:lipopolysaccharide/colanic/teichoic acid biosynthesis glycosyltransferase
LSLLTATLALILDLAALAALEPDGAVLRAALAALPFLLFFRHWQPRRGRGIQTLVAAALLSSAGAWCVLLVWSTWVPAASATRSLLPLLVFPWPGHLLALVPGLVPAVPREEALVHDAMARAVKRAGDLVGCVLFGLPAIPVLVIAAALVRLTTPGPAFYSQIRITRLGKPFRIWKLRTMVRDAEVGKAVWPEENDPRITRLGRVLRLLWLDEVPQLWNVLCGQMSLIGPRPERPEFVEAFAAALPKYRERHAVSAGITGLAQVTGLIGNTSIRRRLALDLLYVRVWTPGLDVWILGGTVTQAFRRALGKRASKAGRAPHTSGLGGSIRELRGVARHLPERDQ